MEIVVLVVLGFIGLNIFVRFRAAEKRMAGHAEEVRRRDEAAKVAQAAESRAVFVHTTRGAERIQTDTFDFRTMIATYRVDTTEWGGSSGSNHFRRTETGWEVKFTAETAAAAVAERRREAAEDPDVKTDPSLAEAYQREVKDLEERMKAWHPVEEEVSAPLETAYQRYIAGP